MVRARLNNDAKHQPESSGGLLEWMPSPVLLHRQNGSCDYVNRRFVRVTGLDAAQAEGLGWRSAVHSADLNLVLATWLDEGNDSRECKFRLRSLNGCYRWTIGRSHRIGLTEEVGVRWLTVLTDVHDLIEAAAVIDRRTQQLQLALTAGRLGTWEFDLTTSSIQGDSTFFDHFGLASRGPVPLEHFVSLLHPHRRDALRLALAQRSEGTPEFELELPSSNSDASRWITLRGRYEGSEGMARVLGVSFDATVQRRSQVMLLRDAHRELAIQEMRHRMANLFPVIHAMVSMTAQHHEDVGSLTEALSRQLRALQSTHELLARELSGAAFIEELVRLQFAPYDADDRIRIEGLQLSLADGTAESFAMIVHELVTNSVKYGALSVPDGQLHVRWWLESADTSSQLIVFQWSETSGASFNPTGRHGYGSSIIGLVGSPIVGTRAELQPLPAGFRYTLVLPYAAGAGQAHQNKPHLIGGLPASS